jgi:hypothetical protein
MALKPTIKEALDHPVGMDGRGLNNSKYNMSKPPDKRGIGNARIVADTLKFLAADQRRADKSRRAIQKLRGKSSLPHPSSPP